MNIKKLICLILAVMILGSLCGCGKKGITILPAAYDSTTQHEFSTTGDVAKVGVYNLAFDEKLGFYSCTVPTFMQHVLTELIDNGDFERHINRVRRRKRKELSNK